MSTFQYPLNSYSNQTMTSVMSLEDTERLADLFEAKGISPFTGDYDLKTSTTTMRYLNIPEIMAIVENVNDQWKLDVSHILSNRTRERIKADIIASYTAVENPVIRAYLLQRAEQSMSYLRKAEIRDLSSLKPVRPYKPQAGCESRLKLKEAVSFYYEQASYADHSRYIVPVEIAEGADLNVCRANLGRFADSLRTHTGMAGSGCNWTITLHIGWNGAFVEMDCRASIAD